MVISSGIPLFNPGTYIEYVQKLGHEARPGSIRRRCRAFVQRLGGWISERREYNNGNGPQLLFYTTNNSSNGRSRFI